LVLYANATLPAVSFCRYALLFVVLSGLWTAPGALAATALVHPTSSPSLRFGMSTAARGQSLPITTAVGAAPKILYSVRLDPRRSFSRVTVRGMLQTAYCRSDDILGENKPNHPCVGSQPYTFQPNIYARLVAATSPTATTGRVISPWKGMPCDKVVHHCPLTVEANRAVVSGAGRYVNLVASAQAQGAGSGQVLAVEPTQGELQVIQAVGPHAGGRALISGPRLPSFAVSAGSSEASKNGDRPAIIFSRLVTVRPGDVLEVRTHFALTIHNSKDNAPFTGTSIFLTRRRTATFGDRAMTVVARAGQNCPTTCSLTRLGAIRSPIGGRLHVNVVVVVKDHEGQTAATASYRGTLTVTKR
jgi:hypothetical protein